MTELSDLANVERIMREIAEEKRAQAIKEGKTDVPTVEEIVEKAMALFEADLDRGGKEILATVDNLTRWRRIN